MDDLEESDTIMMYRFSRMGALALMMALMLSACARVGPTPVPPTAITVRETVVVVKVVTATSPPQTPETPISPTPVAATPEVPSPTDATLPSRTPLPTSVLLDDFEGYTDGDSLSDDRWINAPNNSGAISLGVPPYVHDGSRSLRLDYKIENIAGDPPTDYVGVEMKTSGDWSHYRYFSVWIRSDRSNKDLVIQLTEANGEPWRYRISLSSVTEDVLRIPFSAFEPAGWYQAGDNHLDLKSINNYSFYVGSGGAGSGTVFIDSVLVTR
jgi:hypothetical protein